MKTPQTSSNRLDSATCLPTASSAFFGWRIGLLPEFAVLLPDVDAVDATAVAERIRRQISSLAVHIDAGEPPTEITGLTISIGGAPYPSAGITSLDDLHVAADTALYAAKTAGRDRVHLATTPLVPAQDRGDQMHHDQ